MTNIVITGCSTGIGLETAIYLKDKFINVYPTARDPKDVEMLKELGFDNVMQLDVRKPDEIEAVITNVLEIDGKVDVWFNNAGFGQPGAIEDIKTDILREQFETNVFGLHECTRQIIPVMREQGYGKIIQHSSVLGIISMFGKGSYNASKYAIEGLTDTLRLELNGSNIHAVLLNTGPITSDFRKNAVSKLEKNVDMKNSIFSENNNTDNEKFADFASDVSLFHNNTVWATTNFEVGNAQTVLDGGLDGLIEAYLRASMGVGN